MRLDKFLKVSRLLKRRTVAVEAVNGGRIRLNDREVKPSHPVNVGDVIELGFSSGAVKVKIVDIKETVRKEEAENLYQVLQD